MHKELGHEGRPLRPNPWQWLKYLFGAGLPPELHAWVLHDVTSPTWALRQVARTLLLLAPLIVVVLLVPPGPFWIRGMAALGGLLLGLIFSIAYMSETTENRVKKAGYPAGTAQAVRDQAQKSKDAERTARLQAAAAKRAARYRERQGR